MADAIVERRKLHQMIEVKEGVDISMAAETIEIPHQLPENSFGRYIRLSG